MVGMRKDPKVGGGVNGTCEVAKNQTQPSPRIWVLTKANSCETSQVGDSDGGNIENMNFLVKKFSNFLRKHEATNSEPSKQNICKKTTKNQYEDIISHALWKAGTHQSRLCIPSKEKYFQGEDRKKTIRAYIIWEDNFEFKPRTRKSGANTFSPNGLTPI
ncbi:hypothetical protein Lal_00046409 [Lupinus albus]|nr:hypothetical protein Lal_00046409 [Lupinus albus]